MFLKLDPGFEGRKRHQGEEICKFNFAGKYFYDIWDRKNPDGMRS